MSSLRSVYDNFTKRFQASNFRTDRGFIYNMGDHIDRAERSLSLFNEQKTVERTPIINLNAIYPLSLFRDVWTGTVTHEVDRYTLQPGATLETAKIGRYVAGFSAEGGLGFIKDPNAEGRWGLYNLRNGFFFEDTIANGFRVGYRRGGADTTFNTTDTQFMDKLDGKGPSGITYDSSQGYIFQVDFPYYGFGPIVFQIGIRNTMLGSSIFYPFAIVNVPGNTSTSNPNLPIRAENIGSSGTVSVTGRQYSIIGKTDIATRKTGASSNIVTLNDVGYTPIASFRRKLGNEFEFYTMSTDLIKVINGSAPVEIAMILNPTLTGAVPFTPDLRSAGETSIEFDRSATSFTGGEMFFSDLLPGSSNNNEKIADEDNQRIEIPRNYWATLVGRTLAGTSDVRAHIRALEQF